MIHLVEISLYVSPLDQNSDLNMLSDPEHPQALEHHVQLKAGMYKDLLMCFSRACMCVYLLYISTMWITVNICHSRWSAFPWCGSEAVGCRVAEGFPAASSWYGWYRTRGLGCPLCTGTLCPPPVWNWVCRFQRGPEPRPACVSCHQQETETQGASDFYLVTSILLTYLRPNMTAVMSQLNQKRDLLKQLLKCLK